MPREVRGKGTNVRHVRNILPETAPADGLLVVEVITPGGHWSSYPPHKHDTATDGEETALEETYYHRLNPSQGFAFQRVYTDDRSLDETVCVQDGDVVMVPRGYHPVGAPHGYDLYYLNVMAGPHRKWIFRNDPAHDWIMPARPDPGLSVAVSATSSIPTPARSRRAWRWPRANWTPPSPTPPRPSRPGAPPTRSAGPG
jgi:5-deoxy-glucuronate isomerase